MRKLIYVPVLHISADLGGIGSEIDRRAEGSFGEGEWQEHKEAILGFWNSVARYFSSLEVENLKVYQDGLVADGEIGLRIVSEGAKSGSKNYEIVSQLISRGAQLVKSEDFSVVKKEYDYILKITRSKTLIERIIAALNYKFHKRKLLRARDEFVAQRIDKTLEQGETGVLFLGAQHEIVSKLPEDIEIIELKKRDKLSEFQKEFLSGRNPERLNQLSKYLVSPIN